MTADDGRTERIFTMNTRKSPGSEPGQSTAGRIDFIAQKPLLCKPLKDHLSGLLNRLDAFSDDRKTHELIDCAWHLLNELGSLDRQGVRHGH